MKPPFHVFFGEMDLGEGDASSRAAEESLRFDDISGILEKKGKEGGAEVKGLKAVAVSTLTCCKWLKLQCKYLCE